MNKQQLTHYAVGFLIDHFDLELTIPIRISNRMTSTFGRFNISVNRRQGIKQAKEIAMSGEFIRNRPKAEVLDVLYHECVHYALFETGKPYRDVDQHFKDTVDRLGISRTQTYAYKGTAYKYECKECGGQVIRYRKGIEKRYKCGTCPGRFRMVGTVEV